MPLGLTEVTQRGPSGPCAYTGFVSQLRDADLRTPQYMRRGCKQNCVTFATRERLTLTTGQQTNTSSAPKGRHYLCLPSLFSVQTSLKRQTVRKGCQLLERCVDMGVTHGKLFPRIPNSSRCWDD